MPSDCTSGLGGGWGIVTFGGSRNCAIADAVQTRRLNAKTAAAAVHISAGVGYMAPSALRST